MPGGLAAGGERKLGRPLVARLAAGGLLRLRDRPPGRSARADRQPLAAGPAAGVAGQGNGT